MTTRKTGGNEKEPTEKKKMETIGKQSETARETIGE